MHYKVIDFLYEIGFTDEDIEEFCYVENDGFDNKGNPWYGTDVLFAVTYSDEKWVELRETGEIIEAYWEKGWVGDYCKFHRSNFESYDGRYYKVFPSRYWLRDFKFTKSLRRVLNKNRDLKTVIRPLRITPDKSDLYDTYNYLRHGESPRKPLRELFKYYSDDDSKKLELCIFKENKLVACSFFEEGMYALYGNMAFWDVNEIERSLGTLTILLEVQYALRKNFYYYYIGHFYAQNPNYHYKARFGGFQLFDWDTEIWIPFTHPLAKTLLKQKLPRYKEKDKG